MTKPDTHAPDLTRYGLLYTDSEGWDMHPFEDGEYVKYEDVIKYLASPAPAPHVMGRWRVIEAATGPGYWGIESEEAGNDDDLIMYPIKVHRDTVARIVDAHNAALAIAAEDDR